MCWTCHTTTSQSVVCDCIWSTLSITLFQLAPLKESGRRRWFRIVAHVALPNTSWRSVVNGRKRAIRRNIHPVSIARSSRQRLLHLHLMMALFSLVLFVLPSCVAEVECFRGTKSNLIFCLLENLFILSGNEQIRNNLKVELIQNSYQYPASIDGTPTDDLCPTTERRWRRRYWYWLECQWNATEKSC